MERYANAIVSRPQSMRGRWGSCIFGNLESRTARAAQTAHVDLQANRSVVLDLGCGKGDFAVGYASAHPRTLVVGLDVDSNSIACAAKLACESGLANVVFAPVGDNDLENIFSSGELDHIFLNFPTPYPRARTANQRLVHADRLAVYRTLLQACEQRTDSWSSQPSQPNQHDQPNPSATSRTRQASHHSLHVRTDNHALYLYTLGQLQVAGFDVVEKSEDARNELVLPPMTGYERRALELGAKICSITAEVANTDVCEAACEAANETKTDNTHDSGSSRNTLPESLYDYISEDISPSEYTPPEMRRGIEAIMRTREQSLRRHRS